MNLEPEPNEPEDRWEPIGDPENLYSTGIPDFDRRLAGGYQRGSLAMFDLDPSVTPEDRDLLFTPMILNFLYHSRGMIAVLPARDSPHDFRTRLTRYTTRRRFDTRIRIVDYVGEDDEVPYVVSLKRHSSPKDRNRLMKLMSDAERAAQGGRKKAFIELNAFEILEMVVGPETAARMFLHGVKRARTVGNLVIGLLRPGLKVADAVRGMADTEFSVRRDEVGLLLRGIRPSFPNHLVAPDPARGLPHVVFVPSP